MAKKAWFPGISLYPYSNKTQPETLNPLDYESGKRGTMNISLVPEIWPHQQQEPRTCGSTRFMLHQDFKQSPGCKSAVINKGCLWE